MRVWVIGREPVWTEALTALFKSCHGISSAVAVATPDNLGPRTSERAHESVIVVMTVLDTWGVSTLRELDALGWRDSTIVVIGEAASWETGEILRMGARQVVYASGTIEALWNVISSVTGQPLPATVLNHEGGANQSCPGFQKVRSTSQALSRLSPRELQLLSLLGRGASLKEAALQMHISYKTADNHKTSLMRKLDIHDRVQLTLFAVRCGLVDPDEPWENTAVQTLKRNRQETTPVAV